MNIMKEPVYNVILWDINRDTLEYYDVMPYFINEWKEEKKKKHKTWNLDALHTGDNIKNNKMPETYDEFKKFILDKSMYQFWARCEYECIVSGWPVKKNEVKIDAYDQIKANIDVITPLFMEYALNSTKKKKYSDVYKV
jgi:hypothetical protein